MGKHLRVALIVLGLLPLGSLGSLPSTCLAQGQGSTEAGGANGTRPFLEKLKQSRAQRRRASADAPSAVPANPNMDVAVDLPYGKDQLQKLDIYTPKNAKALPVVLFAHGGGWRGGDKSQQAHKDKGSVFTEHGVVFVSANYRLSPEVKHPAHEEDVASAFAWVKANIAKYGGDSENVYLMGHSAGAHLVDLLGTNGRFVQAHKLSLADIKGVVSLDTATLDLFDRTSEQNGIAAGILTKGMFESAFGHEPKTYTDASPTLNIHKGSKYPKFLMFSGEKRKDATAQHQKFVDAMKAAGGTVEWLTVPLSHREVNMAESDVNSDVFKRTIVFVGGKQNVADDKKKSSDAGARSGAGFGT